MSNSQDKIITEPESRNSGVGHSEVQGSGRGSRTATPTELAQALAMSQQQNAALQQEIAELKREKGSDDDIVSKLTAAIVAATSVKPAPTQPVGPVEADPVNRTTDFQAAKTRVDGRSMMEAQQTAMSFRNETKKPISIPKILADVFGPTLDITVNGVRVSIPCDGRTYFINETHWEHAKERMAKVDAINTDDTPQIKEIG